MGDFSSSRERRWYRSDTRSTLSPSTVMIGMRVTEGVPKGGTDIDESGGQIRLMARAFPRILAVFRVKRSVMLCASWWRVPLEGSTSVAEGGSSGSKLLVRRKSVLGSLPWPNGVAYRLCWGSDALGRDAEVGDMGEGLSFRLFGGLDGLSVATALFS